MMSRNSAKWKHRGRIVAASLFAGVLVASLASAVVAQEKKDTKKSDDKKPDDKKPDPKKPEPKKPDPKKAGAKKGDNFTPINCVIVLQYQPDMGSIPNKIAFNKDLMASAKAVGGKLNEDDAKAAGKKPEDLPKDNTVLKEVNKTTKFPTVLASFRKDKQCCKKIEIVGHGATDGSIDLPYDNDGIPDDMGMTDREKWGAAQLGGPKAKQHNPEGGKVDPADWLDNFVKQIKGAMCPEPEDKSYKRAIIFDGCYSAVGGGIAQQIQGATGISTGGYTSTCDFPHDEDTGKGGLPKPREGGTSKYEEFPGTSDEGSMIFPGRNREGYNVSFASDGGKWCTYDNGTDVPAPISFADRNGEPISYTPPIAMTDPPPTATDPPPPGTTTDGTPPPPAKTPVTPPVTPPVATTTDTTPPPPAKTPETPPVTTTDNTPPPAKTPDAPPPTTPPDTPPVSTTDNPPPPVIPDTVFVKAKESVLDGGNTGQAIQGQTIKLLAEKPALPGSGQIRTAQTDAGFDKPPAQCTTGADGGCKIDIVPEDRPTYKLPMAANQPKQNYRIDVDIRKTSGAVFETTRNKPNLSGIPNGVSTANNVFQIGNRTFTRIAFYADAGVNFSIGEKFNQPGSDYEEDFCRDKQPGPPLGSEAAASGPPAIGLPHTRLRLPLAGKGKRR